MRLRSLVLVVSLLATTQSAQAWGWFDNDFFNTWWPATESAVVSEMESIPGTLESLGQEVHTLAKRTYAIAVTQMRQTEQIDHLTAQCAAQSAQIRQLTGACIVTAACIIAYIAYEKMSQCTRNHSIDAKGIEERS